VYNGDIIKFLWGDYSFLAVGAIAPIAPMESAPMPLYCFVIISINTRHFEANFAALYLILRRL